MLNKNNLKNKNMAIQTLNTIKKWFRTGLKPTQTQFWDTWDSFRHKSEKVPVGDIENIDELLSSKTDKSDFKTINGESILGSGDIGIDGGGSQDLRSVLNTDNVGDRNIVLEGRGGIDFYAGISDITINPDVRVDSYGISGRNNNLDHEFQSSINLFLTNRTAEGSGGFYFPNKPTGLYTLATTDDIPVVDSVLPVSDSQSGIVDNTSLQELGGVDKLINTVRIGLGAGTTTESTAIGTNVLGVNTTGDFNTGVGFEALKANITGSGNTAVGDWALYSSTTGSSSTALGTNALYLATTGFQNNAFGRGSLAACTTGYQNLAFGNSALKLVTTGTFNVGVGNLALQKVTTTSGNTAIGAAAGQNITGTFNVAVGYLSNGETGTTSTGNYNITMGYQSGRALTSGSNNILIENITNASITSGSNNIIIDSKQKSGVTTGNNNTLIGGWDGAFSPTTSDTVALGTGAGVTRFLSASTGLTTLPTQTNALISADATGKSIVTKSYSDNMGAVVNATTSALSGTALNSAYPSAIAGFRVHCLSISGGAIVYEKTTGGWIQYSTTAVTP